MKNKSKSTAISSAIACALLTTILFASADTNAAETNTNQGVVNINTATVAELAFLPGIGESKAKAIVRHRTKKPFKSIQNIMWVKGIGRKSFQKMRPYLSLKGETTAKKKIKP